MADTENFAQLLTAARSGDDQAWSTLVRVVYADLRRIARSHVGGAFDADTLGTTSLVHECYLRLAGSGRDRIQNRAHFLNLASRVMRQVTCDYARAKLTSKRGGELVRHGIHVLDAEEIYEVDSLVVLDDLLTKLEMENERWARVVECRFFAGLTDVEISEALSISPRTVQRCWESAKDWLAKHSV